MTSFGCISNTSNLDRKIFVARDKVISYSQNTTPLVSATRIRQSSMTTTVPSVSQIRQPDTGVPNLAARQYQRAHLDYAASNPVNSKLIFSAKYGKPSLRHSFTSDITFDYIYIYVITSEYLNDDDQEQLSACHPLYSHLNRMISRINLELVYRLSVDTKDYATQKEIPFVRRMQFLFSALIHKFNPPSMIRSLRGNYVADYRDPHKILSYLKPIITSDVYEDLERILITGSPSLYHGHVTMAQRKINFDYGNHPSVLNNIEKVRKALNKEDRNKWVMVLPKWTARFIPHMITLPTGLVIKPGKNDRFIFDGSFRVCAEAAAAGIDFSSKQNEPEIIFGKSFLRHLIRIYNLRISYPNKDILLFDDDVSGAFRHVKHHPDIAAALSMTVEELLYVPIGQTFGANFSPSNFETFARARTQLSEFLQKDETLIEKHKKYLDLIKFDADINSPSAIFVQATPDSINKGVFTSSTVRNPTENHMYVDDNLMADIKHKLIPALAASIESLFIILGFPDEEHRKNCLSIDKYIMSMCSFIRVQLGILLNTRTLTINLSDKKRSKALATITHWHGKRKSFTIRQVAQLLGDLTHISATTRWGRFLYISLQHSVYKALKFNMKFVFQNQKFEKFIKLINHENILIAKFNQSLLSKAVWNCSTRFYINKSMRFELKQLHYILSNPSLFEWSIPIRHIIPTDYDSVTLGDACLTGGGAFNLSSKFWWFIAWPIFIQERTIKFGKHSQLISINCLEFVVIIISYNANLDAREQFNLFPDIPHPKMLIRADNTTADVWTRKIASSSVIGKNLNRILCSLLTNQVVGLDSDYVEGDTNTCADSISRLTKQDFSSPFSLFQQFPELASCHRYHPPQELLSLIYDALLNKQDKVPIPLRVRGHFALGSSTG